MDTTDSFQITIRSRRSVRHFLPQVVPDEMVNRILETASYAPSAHNRQPWRFVIIRSAEAKSKLAEKMGFAFKEDLVADGKSDKEAEVQVERSRRRILEAPLVIMLFLDLIDMDVYPDERRQKAEKIMAVQSVAMAGGTLLLAAHGEGLGGVWVCGPLFASDAVHEALDIPSAWEPQGMLLIGYPARIPEARLRKQINDVSRFL